jgi:BirA family biotin operon repressor/biotin-[acetyl-CoA-carboxylase] ligase
LLDIDKIRENLLPEAEELIEKIEIFPEMDSTNSYLNERIGSGLNSGCVCLAESQTQGKGRHGKSWVSPFASNIYLSLYWKFDLSPMALGGLSLAIGVAVARALSSYGVSGIGLKWPNDLLWNNRKLGGILLEVSGEMSGPCNVVIGIGLNINMNRESGKSIDQPWVDLSEILDQEVVSRNKIIGHILGQLVSVLDSYPEYGAKRFLEEWRRWDVVTGKKVRITLPGNEYSGTVLGIDDEGMLILDSGKEVRKFSSGEVSLRVNS